jgi:hypothetical protein
MPLFEIFELRKAIVPVTIIGLLAVLGLNISEFNSPESYYNNMIIVSFLLLLWFIYHIDDFPGSIES